MPQVNKNFAFTFPYFDEKSAKLAPFLVVYYQFQTCFHFRYNSFYEKYAGLPFSKHPEKYVKFTPAEVSSQIDSFFDAAAWNIFYIGFTFVVLIFFKNDSHKIECRLSKLSMAHKVIN